MNPRPVALLAGLGAILVAVFAVARPPSDSPAAGASASPSAAVSPSPELSQEPSASAIVTPTLPGRFAFAARRTASFEIYTMRPDGSELAQLTDDPAVDRLPTWSPDGKAILFTRIDVTGSSIWVMNGDGSDARRLTAGTDPQWSSDGSRIAYSANGIAVMNADGTGQQSVLPENTAGLIRLSQPTWSADGSRLAFIGEASGSDVYSVALDGSGLERLTVSGPEEASPRTSPDGRLIAYLEHRMCVCTMNVDGSGTKELMSWTGKGAPLSWSPDGTWIAVAGGAEPSTNHPPLDIRVVRSDGSEEAQLTNTGDYGDISWGP